MKRSIIAMLVLGLLAGAIAAPASAQKKKKKKPAKVERTVEYEYTLPSPAVNPAPGLAAGACMSVIIPDYFACIDIPTSATEMFAAVEVVDSSGQKAYFTMSQDVDGDNISDIFGQFCGSTPPVAITPGLDLRVNVSSTGDPNCPGPATSGTITTTISNLP